MREGRPMTGLTAGSVGSSGPASLPQKAEMKKGSPNLCGNLLNSYENLP